MGEAKRRDKDPYRFRLGGQSYKYQWKTEITRIPYENAFMDIMSMKRLNDETTLARLDFLKRRLSKHRDDGLLCIDCDEEYHQGNLGVNPDSILIIKVIPQHQGQPTERRISLVCHQCAKALDKDPDATIDIKGFVNPESITFDIDDPTAERIM